VAQHHSTAAQRAVQQHSSTAAQQHRQHTAAQRHSSTAAFKIARISFRISLDLQWNTLDVLQNFLYMRMGILKISFRIPLDLKGNP